MAGNNSGKNSIFTRFTSMITKFNSIVNDGFSHISKALFGGKKDETEYIPVLKHSTNLGLSAAVCGEKIVLSATDVLLGDMLKLKTKQVEKLTSHIEKLTKGAVSLVINHDEKTINFKIDIKKIEYEIEKAAPDCTEEKRSALIKGKIAEVINSSINSVAEATGGELKSYTDLKLLKGICERLYTQSKEQSPLSAYENLQAGLNLGSSNKGSEVVNSKLNDLINASDHNMTNPCEFGHSQNNNILQSAGKDKFDQCNKSFQDKKEVEKIGKDLAAIDLKDISTSDVSVQSTVNCNIPKNQNRVGGRS